MLPSELSKAPPRDIDISHELFKKNMKRVKGILAGSIFIIPLVALIFWLKFGDLMAGVYWGLGIGAFCELFGVALLVNTKRSVELFKNGTATIGLVESIQSPGDRQGNAYIVLKVSYADKQGMTYRGNVATVGKSSEADRKAGDEITILYFEDKPMDFAIYSPGIGISRSRSKPAS